MSVDNGINKAFNVVFKELIVLIRCETDDAALKSAIKQKYKKFETLGDGYLAEYDLEDPAVADKKLDGLEDTFTDADSKVRYAAIVSLLTVLKKLAVMEVAACVMVPVYDAIVARSSTGLGGVILDAELAAEVQTAVDNIDAETADAFAAVKASVSPKSTDIMSIARDVSQTIDIDGLMKNGMDPSSSTMQDMVANVSKDIQTRIDKGEVDQDQLMQEASELLSSFGGSGGLGDMMKAMMGGGGIPAPPAAAPKKAQKARGKGKK